MASTDYHFVDRWRVQGTVQEVADVMKDAADYPRWWRAVYLDVRVIERGTEDGVGETGAVHAKGWLPYTIRFNYRVTESRYPLGFSLDARGDLTGRGIWTFVQDGPWVNITYDWTIRADKPLLRYASFLLKPVFRSNHIWTMKKGEESLRLELARRRARTPEERARIPAPPGPVTTSPRAFILGAVGAVEVKHTVVIGRPIEEVFVFLTNLDNEKRWQPDIQELGWTTDGPVRPGSTFREVRLVMGRPVELICEVTAFEPNRRFCIRTIGGELPFTSCRLFEAVAGGTKTTQATDVQLRGVFKLLAPVIARRARRQLAVEMGNLKSILEDQN